MVGSYDPRVNRIELKADRIQNWMKEGATVSDTVHNLLVTKNIIQGKKINVLPKNKNRKPEVAEAPAETAAPEAPVEAPVETTSEVGDASVAAESAAE